MEGLCVDARRVGILMEALGRGQRPSQEQINSLKGDAGPKEAAVMWKVFMDSWRGVWS